MFASQTAFPLSHGLFNCQNAPLTGISTAVSASYDWWTLLNPPPPSFFLRWGYCLFLQHIQWNSIFFVIRLLCRVEMCLQSLYPIPKLLWLVFGIKPFLGSCMHHKVFGIQTWNFAIFFSVQYVLWIKGATSRVSLMVFSNKNTIS